jgi:hypothetical protein
MSGLELLLKPLESRKASEEMERVPGFDEVPIVLEVVAQVLNLIFEVKREPVCEMCIAPMKNVFMCEHCRIPVQIYTVEIIANIVPVHD